MKHRLKLGRIFGSKHRSNEIRTLFEPCGQTVAEATSVRQDQQRARRRFPLPVLCERLISPLHFIEPVVDSAVNRPGALTEKALQQSKRLTFGIEQTNVRSYRFAIPVFARPQLRVT